MLNYAVSLERRYDGLFIATFPDLPEAVAYGRDDEEALEEAEITLKATFSRMEAQGEILPPPVAVGRLKVPLKRA